MRLFNDSYSLVKNLHFPFSFQFVKNAMEWEVRADCRSLFDKVPFTQRRHTFFSPTFVSMSPYLYSEVLEDSITFSKESFVVSSMLCIQQMLIKYFLTRFNDTHGFWNKLLIVLLFLFTPLKLWVMMMVILFHYGEHFVLWWVYFATTLSGFESWLIYLVALFSLASYLIALPFSFFICSMGTKIVPMLWDYCDD